MFAFGEGASYTQFRVSGYGFFETSPFANLFPEQSGAVSARS